MTNSERIKYRIACILYDSMNCKSSAMVCEKYGISLVKLYDYEKRYSTTWVLNTISEMRDKGLSEEYIL
jgi:hypothetical protein